MEGVVRWKSPSNIALIKYWGKHGNQLPNNPSLSITLQNSFTDTEVAFQTKKEKGLDVELLFEGKPAPDFEKRIFNFLSQQSDKYPFLKQISLKINSSNTFPHSSGIASSASAFSALALCILNIELFSGKKRTETAFFQEASFLARLGSGSASRSVYGGFVVWGKMHEFQQYSDDFAVPLCSETHPIFNGFQDSILLVSEEKKKVGSTAGHALMAGHPYAEARYKQAEENCLEMHQVLKSGDMERFVEIVENEALSLHGLMLASNPGYLLIKSNTIEIIGRIRAFRQETKIPVSFTLDAGPNVHLLYPTQYKIEVNRLINDELLLFCSGKKWIDDRMGKGPENLTNS